MHDFWLLPAYNPSDYTTHSLRINIALIVHYSRVLEIKNIVQFSRKYLQTHICYGADLALLV